MNFLRDIRIGQEKFFVWKNSEAFMLKFGIKIMKFKISLKEHVIKK